MPERLGRYILEGRIAAGGMAEVFLAKQSGPEGFEKVCVIKRMLSHLAEEPQFVRMFFDEARLVAQLNHPNIAQIFDFGEVDGTYFLAMEYVPGGNLRKIVKSHAKAQTFVAPHLVARIVAEAATALHYAHTATGLDGKPLHIIHRDVSPQNVLLGTSGVVKLIDFGVAKARTATQKTAAGLVKGKFAYMSPEQIRGQTLDGRSDIYGLGLVLYELLANRRAILGANDAEMMKNAMRMNIAPLDTIRTDVPGQLLRIIDRSLRREADQRFESAAAMAVELERFVVSQGHPITGADLAALLGEDAAPPKKQKEIPSESGLAAVVPAPPVPPAFWESTPNAPTTIDPNVAVGAAPIPSNAPTSTAVPPGLVPKGAAPPPLINAVPTRIKDRPAEVTPSPGAVVAEHAESSASLIKKGIRRPTWQWALAVVVLGALVAGGVWLFGGGHEPPAAGPSVAPAPIVAAPPPAPAPSPPPPAPAPPPVAPSAPIAEPAKQVERTRPERIRPAHAHASASLAVLSSPMMAVRIDGHDEGRTPVEVSVPAGNHTIELSESSLGLSQTRNIQLQAGESRREEWNPIKGHVVVRAMPYAEVFLGRQSLGLTPMDPIELYEGRHTFRFVNPDTHRSETREVDVQPGKDTLVKVDLRPPL